MFSKMCLRCQQAWKKCSKNYLEIFLALRYFVNLIHFFLTNCVFVQTVWFEKKAVYLWLLLLLLLLFPVYIVTQSTAWLFKFFGCKKAIFNREQALAERGEKIKKRRRGREKEKNGEWTRFVYVFFSVFSFNLLFFIIAYCIFVCIFAEPLRSKNKVIKYSINFDTTRYGRLITIIMWFHCESVSESNEPVYAITFWNFWFFWFCCCCYFSFYYCSLGSVCAFLLFFTWDYCRIYMMMFRFGHSKWTPAISSVN